jgi:tryptophanyl-tRNA synthetase
MRATTDSDGEIRYDTAEKPGVSNLLAIFSALTDRPIPSLEADYAGQGYGALKKDLVEATVNALRPIRERFTEIRTSGELPGILQDNAGRANAIAEATVRRVKGKFGLGV